MREGIEYLNSIFITDIRFLRMFSEQLCDTESKKRHGKHGREFQTEFIHKMMENHREFTDEIPRTPESDKNSNVISFTSDNTEDMMNTHYREFNKYLAL